MPRILITGICGFAGSVIARGLADNDSSLRIIGLDSLIRQGSDTNLEPLRALGIEVLVGDIRDRATVGALPAVDWIVDCAANPSVLAGVDGRTSSQDLLDHNLAGTIHLLEHCRRHRAGFILLSTSRVYSIAPLAAWPVKISHDAFLPDPDRAPGPLSGALSPEGISENFPTEPPVSLYGASKKCSEILALEYGSTFGFPVWINRCGVLAGAGQFGKADQGIFSYWIHSWARRRPLKYIGFGGLGHQVRDCLHPRDLVPLLVRQMQTAPSAHLPPVVNVSGGTRSAMSLRQLSHWCASRFGPHQVESDLTPRPYDIPWIVLDARVARTAWHWTPATGRDSILEEIAGHAEQNPGWLDAVA